VGGNFRVSKSLNPYGKTSNVDEQAEGSSIILGRFYKYTIKMTTLPRKRESDNRMQKRTERFKQK
jgi:hypothetical protein